MGHEVFIPICVKEENSAEKLMYMRSLGELESFVIGMHRSRNAVKLLCVSVQYFKKVVIMYLAGF